MVSQDFARRGSKVPSVLMVIRRSNINSFTLSAPALVVFMTMKVSQSPDWAMVTIFSPVLLPPSAFGASVCAPPPAALAVVSDVPADEPPHAESSMADAREAAITLTKLRLIMFLLLFMIFFYINYSFLFLLNLCLGIQRIPDSVTHKVDAGNRQHQKDARRYPEPRPG